MNQKKKLGRPAKDPNDRRNIQFYFGFTAREVKMYGGEKAMRERMERAARLTSKVIVES